MSLALGLSHLGLCWCLVLIGEARGSQCLGPWHRVRPYTLSVCGLSGSRLMAVEKVTAMMTLPITPRHQGDTMTCPSPAIWGHSIVCWQCSSYPRKGPPGREAHCPPFLGWGNGHAAKLYQSHKLTRRETWPRPVAPSSTLLH